ncbi:MAG: hypothetical protein JWM41_719 [Gemmatimonadetes bacterium]|nr:hypothetical protein [Gemmatimonadota bacterium]
MNNGTASRVASKNVRILARTMATELTDEALRAVRQPSASSTLLSTGSLTDEEDA